MNVGLKEILQKIGTQKDVPVAYIFKDNKLLIGLRNYTPDKWKNISVWTVPGGRCDNNETLEKTLRREILEEVGIDDFEVKEYLGNVPGAKKGDNVFIFIVETKQEPKLLEPEKFSEWIWCPLSQIPKNFINSDALKLLLKYKSKFYVYILRTSSNTLYVGQTNDLEKRIREHKAKNYKSAKYLKSFKSFELVYRETYYSRSEALKREHQLKTLSHAQKEELIGTKPLQ